MTEHYYAKKPDIESAPKTWHARLRGESFTFTTDNGVFSKGGIDFGSRFMIETFHAPPINGDFLDLGCGYGAIGIVLARVFQNRSVLLSDVNERALFLADQNKRQNCTDNVSILNKDGLDDIKSFSFSAIVTNPPIRAGKKVVYAMFHDAKCLLKENGQLWVVIQKKQGAPSAQKELAKLFDNVSIVARSKGYFILRATKV